MKIVRRYAAIVGDTINFIEKPDDKIPIIAEIYSYMPDYQHRRQEINDSRNRRVYRECTYGKYSVIIHKECHPDYQTLIKKAGQVNSILKEYQEHKKSTCKEAQLKLLEMLCELVEECCAFLYKLEVAPRQKFVNEHPNNEMDLDSVIEQHIFAVTHMIWKERIEDIRTKRRMIKLDSKTDFFFIEASVFGEYGNKYRDGSLIKDMSVEDLKRRDHMYDMEDMYGK